MTPAAAGVLGPSSDRIGPRPRSVQWLFALLVTALVLGVLTIVAMLTLPDGIPAGYDDLRGLLYFLAIGIAIVLAIDVPLAFAIRRGRRWAWTTRLVFALIGLPAAVLQVVNPAAGSAVERLLWTSSALVAIAIVVLLLVRPTRTFVHVGPWRRPRPVVSGR